MGNSTRSEKPKVKHQKVPESVRVKAELKWFLEDHQIVKDYLLAIITDSYNNNPLFGRADFARDKKTITERFLHEGLPFATVTLPNLFDSVLTYLETGVSDYPGWKKARNAKYPAFLRRLIAPIYEDPNSASTVTCVSQLYQLSVAFKKLEGPYKQGVLVQQLHDFIDADIELRYLEFDAEPNRAILRHARETIREVLNGLDPFDPDQAELFLPRPGPGATNTSTKAHERFRPHVKYTTLNTWFPYREWFKYPQRWNYTPKPLDGIKGLWADFLEYLTKTRIGERSTHVGLPVSYEPASRLKFVPKTYSKARAICIEQLETQYLQQGVKNALYHRIERHPETRGKVNFTDQNVNGRLALYGSSTGKLATIDMSAASDRISRKLVSYLFADNPNMLDALLALSTNTIELPKKMDISFIRDFPSAKYAPMGSALCFPIMALVHYALCKAIIVFSTRPHNEASCVYVYGDDIIVPSGCAQAIYDWLPRFGMKLNEKKSFYRSRFRESCGLHAYNGHVITPARFKSVIKLKPRFNELISALKLESALFYKGYRETARLIRSSIHKVKDYRAGLFPVVSPNSSILGWIREDKEAPHSRVCQIPRRRWRKGTDHRKHIYDYHSLEYRVRCIVPVQETLPSLGEDESYLRKLVTRVKEKPRHVDGSCTDFKIVYKWLPESAF
jgi:hypothetical protein